MNLFDNAPSHTSYSLNQQEAFAAIALIASAIDGYISKEEYDTIQTYLGRMPMYQSMNATLFTQMKDKLYDILETKGYQVLLKLALASLPERLKRTAFICAVDIAFADPGKDTALHIDETEKKFINQLYKALNIPQKEAQIIVQVMQWKNYS